MFRAINNYDVVDSGVAVDAAQWYCSEQLDTFVQKWVFVVSVWFCNVWMLSHWCFVNIGSVSGNANVGLDESISATETIAEIQLSYYSFLLFIFLLY